MVELACATGIFALSLLPGSLRAQLVDTDGDTVADSADDCLRVPNPDQSDTDGDKVGDLCDMCPDTTADVPDDNGGHKLVVDQFGCAVSQQCPCLRRRKKLVLWRSRSEYIRCMVRQTHRFRRLRVITALERVALLVELHDRDHRRCGRIHSIPNDHDGDGIPDDGDFSGVAGDTPCKPGQTAGCDDNCRGIRNPKQRDMDGDGRGDVCDPDVDGDGVPNRRDNCPSVANQGQEDGDGDGVGDACDRCQDTEEDADVDSRGCD